MDLALNNLQRLIKQTNKYYKIKQFVQSFKQIEK